MPLIVNDENSCSVPLDLSYYAVKPGTYEEAGLKFLWANDGGTLKYIGARGAEGVNNHLWKTNLLILNSYLIPKSLQ